MKVFVIGDTHFDHKNIIKYCSRPYSDVEEMNDSLIRNWNNVVSDEDLVIHIGDIAMASKKEKVADFISKLKGRKWLIMGNHDNFKIKDYYDMGFEFVSDKPVIYKEFFILSHKPMFMTENMPYFNIYGHVHDNPMYKDRTENTWCVSVERIGYAPAEFNIEDFDIEIETVDKARYTRKENYKDGSFNLGIFFGRPCLLILADGKLFVEVNDNNFNILFRQEYVSTKTKLTDIIQKLTEVLNDEQHPFTIKIKERIF